MENETRHSFSKINPWLQIAWDSTSLGEAKTCWRKYAYGIIQGYRPKQQSHHLRYGQLYHRALEVYDHKMFEGFSHDDAQRFMLRDLAEGCMDEFDGTRTWWDPNEFLSEEKAASNAKTVSNLFRTVIWYTERFRDDPLTTVKLADGKPAVELSFRFNLGTESKAGEAFMYSGHLDRLVTEADGSYRVVDRKTTGTTIGFGFFNAYSPDNQMSGYIVAANVVLDVPAKGVIIDAVQIAKGFSRFERGYANRTQAQLDEWLSTTNFYVGTLAQLFAEQANAGAGVDAYPMNDKACHNYNGCQFRDTVCSKDPRMRETFLKSNFKVDKWDPLKVRGDI